MTDAHPNRKASRLKNTEGLQKEGDNFQEMCGKREVLFSLWLHGNIRLTDKLCVCMHVCVCVKKSDVCVVVITVATTLYWVYYSSISACVNVFDRFVPLRQFSQNKNGRKVNSKSNCFLE